MSQKAAGLLIVLEEIIRLWSLQPSVLAQQLAVQ